MSHFRQPHTEADRAAHNAGRAAYHHGEGWEQYPPGSHQRAGWAAAASEEADEAHRRRLATTPAPASSLPLLHNS